MKSTAPKTQRSPKSLAPSFGKPANGEDLRSTRRLRAAGVCGDGELGSPLGNCHLTSRVYHGWRNMALCSQVHHHWRVGPACASRLFPRADRGCGRSAGDAAVGKSSLLVRLTDQRFLANPDPTVSTEYPEVALSFLMDRFWTQLGVEFGSKLITIPEEEKVVKLQCAPVSYLLSAYINVPVCRLGYCWHGILQIHN